MQAGVLEAHAGGGEGRLRSDRDAVGRRVPAQHVERLGRAEVEAAALADRELVLAVVVAEHAAVGVDDLARLAQARPAVALQEGAPAEAGHEAEVLALALVRHGQAGVAGQRADGVLGEAAEREGEPVQVAGSSFASM